MSLTLTPTLTWWCAKIGKFCDICDCEFCMLPHPAEPALLEYDPDFNVEELAYLTKDEQAFMDYCLYQDVIQQRNAAIEEAARLPVLDGAQQFLQNCYYYIPRSPFQIKPKLEHVTNEGDGALPEVNATLPQPNIEVEETVPIEHDEHLPEQNMILPEPEPEFEELVTTVPDEDLPALNTTVPHPLPQPLPRPKPKSAKKSRAKKQAGSKPSTQKSYPKRAMRGTQRKWTKEEAELAEPLMIAALAREKALGLKHSEKVYEEVAQGLSQAKYPRTKASVKFWWNRKGRPLYKMEEREKPKNPDNLVTCVRDPTKKKAVQKKRKQHEEDEDTSEVDPQPQVKRRKMA